MQQLTKLTQRVLANNLLIVEGFERWTEAIDQVDIEVITLEFDHDFV